MATYTRRFLRFLIILIVLLSPASAFADATLTISPSTGSSPTVTTFSWVVGGTPNGSDYGDCFYPNGSHYSRMNGGSGGMASDFLQSAGTYSPYTVVSACGGTTYAGGTSGTMHFVGVNVDSGSGFSGWSTNCDSGGSTYSGCSSYLLGDSRTGYFDDTIVFSASSPYVPSTQICVSLYCFYQ